MAKKDSNYLSINVPRYLVKDIDKYLLRTNSKATRSSFIIGALNDYLDKLAQDMDKEHIRALTYKKDIAKKHKLSTRSMRYDLKKELKKIKPYTKAEEIYLKKIREISKKIQKGNGEMSIKEMLEIEKDIKKEIEKD